MMMMMMMKTMTATTTMMITMMMYTGREIIFRLAPVKLSCQIYFCLDKKRFWTEKCLISSKYI